MTKERVIQTVLRARRGRTYLEIGVSAGECFWRILAPRAIAVDPVLALSFYAPWRRGVRRSVLESLGWVTTAVYALPSDEFFARHAALFAGQPIDVALVDGLHVYAQALRDISHCLDHLAPRGVIVVHDCNPPFAAAAIPAPTFAAAARLGVPGWTGDWCGDVWKAIVHLRATREDLDVRVLDCDWGVGLITRGRPAQRLPYTLDAIRAMTYDDLHAHRVALLNLTPASHFPSILRTLSSR